MPDISEMKGGKYLKKEDFPEPKAMTVSGIDKQQIKNPASGEVKSKWVMSFDETDKQLIMGSTTLEQCARATGERNSDNWGGKKITLWADPNVTMGSELVGGVRIKIGSNGAPKTDLPF